jgi:hypothetical protein
MGLLRRVSIAGLIVSMLTIASRSVLAANVSAVISGTFSGLAPDACPTGYAHQCASGQCANVTAVGTPTVTGTFGSGSVNDLCVTVDLGDNVNGFPPEAGGKDTCSPFFGVLTVSVTKHKTTTNTALNIAGVFCHHQNNSPKGTIQGGFGIDGADSTDQAATGWGTITGTVQKHTSVFKLHLKGSFAP